MSSFVPTPQDGRTVPPAVSAAAKPVTQAAQSDEYVVPERRSVTRGFWAELLRQNPGLYSIIMLVVGLLLAGLVLLLVNG